jgi:hypothetical protein
MAFARVPPRLAEGGNLLKKLEKATWTGLASEGDMYHIEPFGARLDLEMG